MWSDNLLIPIITAIAGIAGYFITARIGKSGTREVALINELQEELAEEREARKRLESRVDDLFTKVQVLATFNTLWEIHSTQLEAQISASGGTPIPRPQALIRRKEMTNLD